MASATLTREEKRLGTIASKYFVFVAGLAVSEQKFSNRIHIAENMLKEYEERVSKYDPSSDEYYDTFGCRCRANVTDLLKIQMKAPASGVGSSKSSGAKLWTYFKNIKSEFLNHWCPHLKILPSGDNNQKDDAFEKVRMHVWAYRRNKNIRSANAKCGSEADLQAEVTWESAPDSDSFYPTEMPTFRVYHDHHCLNSPSSSSGVASSTIDPGCNSDSSSSKGNKKVESINRLIVSRKQQRRKEREDRKKRKSTVDFEQIKAAKAKSKMKKRQTSATIFHTKALQTRNMIDLLKLAESSNGKFGDSQELFERAKATIFDAMDKPVVVDLSSDESDVETPSRRRVGNVGTDNSSDVETTDNVTAV